MLPARKQVLLVGSGMMAQAVVKKLVSNGNNDITIASNIVADAVKIASKYPHCSGCEVDVLNEKSLGPLVEKADIVISYIPAVLHIHVAKQCLRFKKNLVTASYVSQAMRELHDEVAKNDLIFLNELGVDPGIDHMSTMKVVNQVAESGGKILQYESWCGGLPSPQFCDNPLGYKFTWSPIGALRAAKNDARFILGGKQYVLPQKDLLYCTEQVEINAALTMQGYANRDSLSYQQTYHLENTSKVKRGTLRYRGYCTLIAAFKEIGLFTQTPVSGSNWREYISSLVANEKPSPVDKELIDEVGDEELFGQVATRTVYNVQHYNKLSAQEKERKAATIIKGMKFFGLLSASSAIAKPTESNLENLVAELDKKLKLNPGETDLLAMQHIFRIQPADPTKKAYTLKSSLIMIGEKGGPSAMSLTVGLPTAIGAQLVLDGKISLRGVVIPTEKQIYEPVLKELSSEGITLREEIS